MFGSLVDDPWGRLVRLIDHNLNAPMYNIQLFWEFWRAGMRDAELRDHAQNIGVRDRSTTAGIRDLAMLMLPRLGMRSIDLSHLRTAMLTPRQRLLTMSA